MIELDDFMDANQLQVGDIFTIAGCYEQDTRSRWQRFVDWILRRPVKRELMQFVIRG